LFSDLGRNRQVTEKKRLMQEKEEKRRISRQSTTRCGCGFHAKSVKYGYHHRAQRTTSKELLARLIEKMKASLS